MTIAEVLDQDGETWVKTSPFNLDDPPGWFALVALGGAEGLLGRERLRLPCGAVLQIYNASVPFNGVVDLFFESEGRPPHLEEGMVLEVVDAGTCPRVSARCLGASVKEPLRGLLLAWLDEQKAWIGRNFPGQSWCNPGGPWP